VSRGDTPAIPTPAAMTSRTPPSSLRASPRSRPYAPLRSKLDTTQAPSSRSARVINGGSNT
jgi:hypothetical protein